MRLEFAISLAFQLEPLKASETNNDKLLRLQPYSQSLGNHIAQVGAYDQKIAKTSKQKSTDRSYEKNSNELDRPNKSLYKVGGEAYLSSNLQSQDITIDTSYISLFGKSEGLYFSGSAERITRKSIDSSSMDFISSFSFGANASQHSKHFLLAEYKFCQDPTFTYSNAFRLEYYHILNSASIDLTYESREYANDTLDISGIGISYYLYKYIFIPRVNFSQTEKSNASSYFFKLIHDPEGLSKTFWYSAGKTQSNRPYLTGEDLVSFSTYGLRMDVLIHAGLKIFGEYENSKEPNFKSDIYKAGIIWNI